MSLDEVLPLITFLLGSMLTLVTETLQYRRQVQREREARAAERAEEKARQRAEFQVKTLLELQETFSQLLGRTQTMMMGGPPSADESQKRSEASLRTQILTVRVENDELREQVRRIQGILIELGETRDADDAGKLWNEAASEFLEANDHLGTLLRELY